jgi:hypothetical protein
MSDAFFKTIHISNFKSLKIDTNDREIVTTQVICHSFCLNQTNRILE